MEARGELRQINAKESRITGHVRREMPARPERPLLYKSCFRNSGIDEGILGDLRGELRYFNIFVNLRTWIKIGKT